MVSKSEALLSCVDPVQCHRPQCQLQAPFVWPKRMEGLEQALRQQREEHLQSLQELQSLLSSGEADPDLDKVCY